ncbi:armadillo-type protein [Chiua virens]|nr:armadillo-type protein [Chiua virens]
MVAQTRTGASSSKKLTFNEKIIGKSLSTDTLLKKLKELHTELAELDQELVEVNSLSAVRSQLINTSLLLHKDRGVKAYTACCLADILRLYAPDAPYTQNELKDIFQFFFRQLSAGLKGTDAPYYNEAVVLVCDLPHSDELMSEVFRDFFALVRRDLAKKIELFIADILVALIDECQSLPSDVLDAIMAQFMDKNTRLDQPAVMFANTLLTFIVTNSRNLDSESDFDEIRTAHVLVKQLSKSCPSLLHSVIPQLEEELRVDQVQVRLIVTQALGEMFAEKGGSDLIKKYPTTWNVWLMRKNDKAAAVRLKLVEKILNLKLLDPDEKVRASVCKVYSQLDYETALHCVSEAQLRAVAGRGMDKKQYVRVEAMNALGKLYSLAYPEIENGDPSAITHFGWIPKEILQISNVTSEAKAAVEQVIADYVLPLPSPSTNSASTSKNIEVDEVAWTDHLLNTMQHLDARSINTILNFSGIKANRPTVYEHYLHACIQNNGGVIDENEDAIIQRLNNVVKASSPIRPRQLRTCTSLPKRTENRLYKLLKTCMDPQSDLKSIVKASNEFLRRVEQSLESTLPTLTILLRRATLRIVNQSSVSTLIKRVQKSAPTSRHAQQLLTFISKHCPTLYKPHVSELTKAIADERNVTLVEVGMHALAAVVRTDESQAALDKRTLERITRFALEENARIAKFAARLLASLKEHEDTCVEIIESIAERLPEATPEELVAHTTVLAQMARFKSDAFEHRSDAIMAFLIKKLLMGRWSNDPEDMDVDEDWVTDENMAPIQQARILALKVCRNRCLAHASSATAVELATPALKMFSTLLEHSGSFTPDAPDSPPVKSRMRLQAAVSFLHLSTVEAYANAISSHFMWLAIAVQDPCFHVRMKFLTKLVSLLTARKLPPRFNVIPFLTIHDPEAEVRDTAIAYILFVMRSIQPAARVEHLEIIFIRLLHLLAHHPDFATAHENMQDMAKYVDFYLDLIASSDNIALLYHLALKAKTVRDSESHTYSENLYTISELAQVLIRTRAQARSWSIQSYPGKVKLPSDILRALPNPDAVAKQYLSDETITWLKEAKGQKPAATKEKKREPKEKDGKSPPAKRKASRVRANGAPKRAKTQKAAGWNSDQSESEEESVLRRGLGS